MKILVLANGFPPRGRWGTEFYTHELVRGLARRGHELLVLHPVRDGSRPRYTLEEEDAGGGVRVLLLHNPGDPRKRFAPSYEDSEVERRVREVLERHRPDVAHFTYLAWGLSVRLPALARSLGVPSVVTLTDYGLLCHRGQMFDQRLERCFGPHPAAVCARCIREPAPYDDEPARLALKRFAVRGLAAVGGAGRVVTTPDVERREAAVRETFASVAAWIAPTRHLLEVFVRGGLPRERAEHLVYAFDESPYAAARASAAPSPPRLGFFGQFAPHKGLATLLEASRRVGRSAPDAAWELVLHGGPSHGRHGAFAEAFLGAGLPAHVRLGAPFEPGAEPEVLAGLSALVIPSEWDENAPLSALQARAAGVAVVGSDVPGVAEVIEQGRHGELVPPGDPAALAKALERVVRGEVGRVEAGLPVGLGEHLERVEGVYGRVRAGGS